MLTVMEPMEELAAAVAVERAAETVRREFRAVAD